MKAVPSTVTHIMNPETGTSTVSVKPSPGQDNTEINGSDASFLGK